MACKKDVALDQGFYNEGGLDVEIIHPSANISSLHLLNDGKADGRGDAKSALRAVGRGKHPADE